MYLIIPALFVAAMNYFAVEVPANSNGGESEYDSGGNSHSYSQGDDITMEDGKEQVRKVAPLPITLSFFVYVVVLLLYGRFQKRKIREKIMVKLYEERMQALGEEVDPQRLKLFLQRHKLDISRAHSAWSFCYARDYDFFDEGGMVPIGRRNTIEDQEKEDDFCSCVWQCLS